MANQKMNLVFKCNYCGIISETNTKCFRCGKTDRTQLILPRLTRPRPKGSGISINTRI